MKALIKETNEILDVERDFEVMKMTFTYNYKSKKGETTTHKGTWTKENEHSKEGQHYKLSDGNNYHEDEVVVGMENIREYKLKELGLE